jgi:hypothetical protein
MTRLLQSLGSDVERAMTDVNVPSYIIDRNGVVAWLNPAAEKIVGDVRGFRFTDVVTPGLALALTFALGVVLTFVTVVAVNRELRRRGFWSVARPEPDLLSFLHLVALGTVADVVPLKGLNRAFVCKGLIALRRREQNADLAAYGVAFDVYFLESSLYTDGKVEETVRELKLERGRIGLRLADDFLPKPFTLNDLARKVRSGPVRYFVNARESLGVRIGGPVAAFRVGCDEHGMGAMSMASSVFEGVRHIVIDNLGSGSITVAAGQSAADLTVNAFNLEGGTVSDVAGNAASLAGATNYNPAGTLKVDTSTPSTPPPASAVN